MTIAFIIIVFALAILFTWTNGYHQASAVAANALGSHSMSRKQVVVLIAVFEFLGTLFGGSAVAEAIQSISDWPLQPDVLPLLASALSSTIIWNLVAGKWKMPASSTHSLIGGMIGALIVGSGNFFYVRMGKLDPLHPTGVIGAIAGLIISPLLGFLAAYALFTFTLFCCLRASRKVETVLNRSQWITTAILAFGDGQNDTQKTMGLLVVALESSGMMARHEIPMWMRVMIGVAMALGAFWINSGLVRELAYGVYELKPLNAWSSELSSGGVLIANSLVGAPVSASQVIAASIMGSGSAERSRGIHWLVIKDILLSWLVTIPVNLLMAMLLHTLIFRWLGNFIS